MSQEKANKNKKIQASLALIALTAVLVGSDIAFHTKSINAMQGITQTMSMSSPSPSVSVATPNTSTLTPTVSSTSSIYKDGSYTAKGSYDSPGGVEGLTVSLMLMDGKVTAVNVQPGANDPTASTYQTSFISGYKKYVVGKSIKSIKLSNVSGSSLTSQGFNEALKKIKQQAEA